MEHSIIYKNADFYASFPLLKKIDNELIISFFVAPVPDHAGLFDWRQKHFSDNNKAWFNNKPHISDYNWPAVSSREKSDRFAYELDEKSIVTGSYGFRKVKDQKGRDQIKKSQSLFIRSSGDEWKTSSGVGYTIPQADIVLTFPRPYLPANPFDRTRLIPTYCVLKNGNNRALAWLSRDFGENWKLYNMFPDEISANEMSFIRASDGILAHIRSDEHPYIMESWSYDGEIWTYPTNIFSKRETIVGGPTHLLRLNSGKILCTYGYRYDEMGIRAIISEDDGKTWGDPIILRNDGGYISSLHKRKLINKFKLPYPGNDLGYPVSIQLKDGQILTAYYITCADRITHIATTKWEV